MSKLRNKISGRVIEVNQHDFDKSMFRLRKTLEVNPEMCARLNSFVSLTFDVENYQKFSPADGGVLCRRMFNRIKTALRKKCVSFDYVWRLEAGKKRGRFHFHVLCNLRFSKKQWECFWPAGMVDVKKVDSADSHMVAVYLSKYISKRGKKHHYDWISNEFAKDIPLGTRLWGVSGGFRYRYLPMWIEQKSTTQITPISELDKYVAVERRPEQFRWAPSDYVKYRKEEVLSQLRLWELIEERFKRRLISSAEYWAIKKVLNKIEFPDRTIKPILV